MTDLVLRYESVEPFTIKINDFLSSRGIVVADVTDAIFAVKVNATDADAAALATKTMQGGNITFAVDNEGDDTMTITLEYTDYGSGKLEIGTSYALGVGFKTAEHTKWLEGVWKGAAPKLRINQDFFRG